MILTCVPVTSAGRPPLLRRLTDDVIEEIAVNRLKHEISKLGLAMDLSLARISKYDSENREVSSRGTKNMIHDWREKCIADDQVEAFCAVLQNAGLRELAGDLSAGMILS